MTRRTVIGALGASLGAAATLPAQAIRSVVRAAGAREGTEVNVDIVD